MVGDKTDFRERREKWWNELRDEVRGHCEMYKCDCVLGYTETLSTASGVCIMSAVGTAVRLTSRDSDDAQQLGAGVHGSGSVLGAGGAVDRHQRETCPAAVMHIPYKTSAFSGKYTQCQMCRRKFIPEVLLASCETPLDLPYAQQPQAFDVHVIRKIRPALEGEQLALHLSQIITFMEYELHSLIVAKLRCPPP